MLGRGARTAGIQHVTDRILLLSYAFPPLAMPEAVLATKRMAGLSAAVDVICAAPPAGMRKDHSLDDYAARHFCNITRIQPGRAWRWAPLPRLGRILTVPDPFVLLNGAARRAAIAKGLDRYAALVTWSQWHSVHLVPLAMDLHGVPRPPWLAHFSDPWVRNSFRTDGPIGLRLNRALERRVLASADRVLFTSDETMQLTMGGHPDSWRAKARVLPHAFDPALYPRVPRGTGPRRELILRYLGTFYGPRSPEPLFRALVNLEARRPDALRGVRVEIIGSVEGEARQTAAARSLVPGRVSIVSPVDYLTSLRLMEEADLLLIVDAPARLSPFLPSKLIDYLGARRPIFGITPAGAAASLIESLGGWVADPTRPDEIASGLERALSAVAAGRADDFGDETVRRRYSVETVRGEMEVLLAGLRSATDGTPWRRRVLRDA
jgi:hypothetical protein